MPFSSTTSCTAICCAPAGALTNRQTIRHRAATHRCIRDSSNRVILSPFDSALRLGVTGGLAQGRPVDFGVAGGPLRAGPSTRRHRKGNRMLRVVERVMGEGAVTRAGLPLGTVAYELTLYRQWASTPDGLVAGDYEVDGHFMAPPARLDNWTGTTAPLVLDLDDGRRVDLYVVNLDGVVTPADTRGFYLPG